MAAAGGLAQDERIPYFSVQTFQFRGGTIGKEPNSGLAYEHFFVVDQERYLEWKNNFSGDRLTGDTIINYLTHPELDESGILLKAVLTSVKGGFPREGRLQVSVTPEMFQNAGTITPCFVFKEAGPFNKGLMRRPIQDPGELPCSLNELKDTIVLTNGLVMEIIAPSNYYLKYV